MSDDDVDRPLREQMFSVAEQNLALRAEIERLRADAERYRWVRSQVYAQLRHIKLSEPSVCQRIMMHESMGWASLDEFIDSERDKEERDKA